MEAIAKVLPGCRHAFSTITLEKILEVFKLLSALFAPGVSYQATLAPAFCTIQPGYTYVVWYFMLN